MSSLMRVLALTAIIVCISVTVASTLTPTEEEEYAAFEAELFEGQINLEQGSSIFAEIDQMDDFPPFVNPIGEITVPLNTNFSILRNHSVAGGGTTAFWGLVTQMGDTNCTDYRAQLSFQTPSCNDTGLVFYGLQNVNIDGTYMTAQFLYTFVTPSIPGVTSISFCTFRPWEECDGNVTTVKVIMANDARNRLDDSMYEDA